MVVFRIKIRNKGGVVDRGKGSRSNRRWSRRICLFLGLEMINLTMKRESKQTPTI